MIWDDLFSITRTSTPRFGKGPWQNVKGVLIAKDIDDLHSPNTNLNKETALTEKEKSSQDASTP
jgi:hypothetical protein